MNRRAFVAAAVASVAPQYPATALAQQQIGRPMTIVIPFAPGGASDIVVRALADDMGAELGRPLVIENRGGAGGLPAAGAVGSAPGDGSTLLYGNQGQILVARHLLPGNTTRPLEMLAPVAMTARVSFLLVVPADSPFKRATDVAAAARAQKLRFGIPGFGTPPHMAAALFGEATRSSLEPVPYQGSSPLLVDLVAGRLDAAFDNVASSLAHVRAGRLRALGISSPTRATVADDVPTLNEAGIERFSYQSWHGFFAPTATPRVMIDTIEKAVLRSLLASQVRTRLEGVGLEVAALGREEFQAVITREAALWDGFVQRGAFKPS